MNFIILVLVKRVEVSGHSHLPEAYSEPCQRSKTKRFTKVVNDFWPLNISAKCSIFDLWWIRFCLSKPSYFFQSRFSLTNIHISQTAGEGGGYFRNCPLHRHLDISLAITAESSPLHIARSRTRTRNIWIPGANTEYVAYIRNFKPLEISNAWSKYLHVAYVIAYSILWCSSYCYGCLLKCHCQD